VHTIIDGVIDGDRAKNQFPTMLRQKVRTVYYSWMPSPKPIGLFTSNTPAHGRMNWI